MQQQSIFPWSIPRLGLWTHVRYLCYLRQLSSSNLNPWTMDMGHGCPFKRKVFPWSIPIQGLWTRVTKLPITGLLFLTDPNIWNMDKGHCIHLNDSYIFITNLYKPWIRDKHIHGLFLNTRLFSLITMWLILSITTWLYHNYLVIVL